MYFLQSEIDNIIHYELENEDPNTNHPVGPELQFQEGFGNFGPKKFKPVLSPYQLRYNNLVRGKYLDHLRKFIPNQKFNTPENSHHHQEVKGFSPKGWVSETERILGISIESFAKHVFVQDKILHINCFTIYKQQQISLEKIQNRLPEFRSLVTNLCRVPEIMPLYLKVIYESNILQEFTDLAIDVSDLVKQYLPLQGKVLKNWEDFHQKLRKHKDQLSYDYIQFCLSRAAKELGVYGRLVSVEPDFQKQIYIMWKIIKKICFQCVNMWYSACDEIDGQLRQHGYILARSALEPMLSLTPYISQHKRMLYQALINVYRVPVLAQLHGDEHFYVESYGPFEQFIFRVNKVEQDCFIGCHADLFPLPTGLGHLESELLMIVQRLHLQRIRHPDPNVKPLQIHKGEILCYSGLELPAQLLVNGGNQGGSGKIGLDFGVLFNLNTPNNKRSPEISEEQENIFRVDMDEIQVEDEIKESL